MPPFSLALLNGARLAGQSLDRGIKAFPPHNAITGAIMAHLLADGGQRGDVGPFVRDGGAQQVQGQAILGVRVLVLDGSKGEGGEEQEDSGTLPLSRY